MFLTRLAAGLCEFALTVATFAIVIGLTYRIFVKGNPHFDMEEQVRKGNKAVGLLVASMVLAASWILDNGMASVVGMIRLYLASPADNPIRPWQALLLALGHLVASLVLAKVTISLTLRLFGRLTHPIRMGEELEKGNMAVGAILASVVLAAALFVGQGVSALTKSLVPQPSISSVIIRQ